MWHDWTLVRQLVVALQKARFYALFPTTTVKYVYCEVCTVSVLFGCIWLLEGEKEGEEKRVCLFTEQYGCLRERDHPM